MRQLTKPTVPNNWLRTRRDKEEAVNKFQHVSPVSTSVLDGDAFMSHDTRYEWQMSSAWRAHPRVPEKYPVGV